MLFVSGTQPLSKLIMWGLSEPCSHFAILFDDKIVFHSTLTGVKIEWYESFLKTHKVEFMIEHKSETLDLEEKVYQEIISKYDGDSYDYKSFLFFTWNVAMLKMFKRPLPKAGASDLKNFLCTEIAATLPDSVVPSSLKALDLGSISPYQLWLLLQGHSKKAQETTSP